MEKIFGRLGCAILVLVYAISILIAYILGGYPAALIAGVVMIPGSLVVTGMILGIIFSLK
jgi:hypothetical protein